MTKRFFNFTPAWTLCLILSQQVHAESSDRSEPVYHIHALDSGLSVEQLKVPGVLVHTEEEYLITQERSLPTVANRDLAFSQAGIQSEISSWDQLDRDLIYLRAKRLTASELQRAYPQIDRAKLDHLFSIIGKGGSK